VFLGAVAVTLRIWAHLMSRIWAVDYVFIALARLCSLGLTIVLNISSLKYGFSRHIWMLKSSGSLVSVPAGTNANLIDKFLLDAGQMGYISKIFYILAVGFIRLSILLFYYRLTANTTWTRTYRIVLHAAVFAVVAICLIFLGLTIFQCK
jgi:hypothetical protein